MTEKDIENLETMIWQGENEFPVFVVVSKTLGYKYVVKCVPMYDDLQDELGAACKDHSELVETLLMFSDSGYSSRVAKVDVVDIEQLN